jgi:hypothetical protein
MKMIQNKSAEDQQNAKERDSAYNIHFCLLVNLMSVFKLHNKLLNY